MGYLHQRSAGLLWRGAFRTAWANHGVFGALTQTITTQGIEERARDHVRPQFPSWQWSQAGRPFSSSSSEVPTFLDLNQVDFGKVLQRQALRGKEVALPEGPSHAIPVLRALRRSGAARDRALALYVNSALYPKAMQAFSESVLERATYRELEAIGQLSREDVPDTLFPAFARFVLREYREDIEKYRALLQTTDLRSPHSWFPLARALKRRIIYHAGPTNSGKTHSALEAMRSAASGTYCGPLRLLAMEIYDTCNALGTFCNLITGQERREIPGAHHTSCTVEMADLAARVDVAVLDEIQMIGDDARGWAWTRALVGIPANEIHLCGDGSALELVEQLALQMGDAFEVRRYERFTKLHTEERGLGDGGYAAVERGDCVVAFSRRDIFEIKAAVEQATAHRCCVVYGALPPETRRQQAQLFNAGSNKYRVLVASDAVGMGLNLNIGRIVFHSMRKREGGSELVPVSTSMVKQIAGRAGRRSSEFAKGRVTCRDAREIPLLNAALDTPLDALLTPKAGLFPEFEHLEVFAGQHPDNSFEETVVKFTEHAVLDSKYFLCKQEGILIAARLLGSTELSLRDMYSFCMAPASSSDPYVLAALLLFAQQYASGAPVTLDLDLPRALPQNPLELRRLETAHAIVNLWLWLSYRFEPEAFPGREEVEKLGGAICDTLHRGLRKVTLLTKARGEGRRRGSSNDASKRAPSALLEQRPSAAHERLLRPFEEAARPLKEAQLGARMVERRGGRKDRRALRGFPSVVEEEESRVERVA